MISGPAFVLAAVWQRARLDLKNALEEIAQVAEMLTLVAGATPGDLPPGSTVEALTR